MKKQHNSKSGLFIFPSIYFSSISLVLFKLNRNKIADLHYIFRFNGYIYALNTKVTASLTPLMHILLIEFLKSCYLSTMNSFLMPQNYSLHFFNYAFNDISTFPNVTLDGLGLLTTLA
ncbi:Protein of unknown function, partial [Gryllus bimaculatus]